MGKKDDVQWKKRLKELKAYKETHGNCLVPQRYRLNKSLGIWVNTQRREYTKWLKGKSSRLTKEKIDLLEDMGFVWIVVSGPILKDSNRFKRIEEQWKQKFNELVKYKEKYGDCLVPRRYEQNNIKLGNWVGNQRREYKRWLKGIKTCRLTQEKVDLLEDIGFVWMDKFKTMRNEECYRFNLIEGLWKQRLAMMRAYKEKHGDCLVPRRYVENNIKLGNWVCYQRAEYKKWQKGEKSQLTQEKVDLLEDIGFVWMVKASPIRKESNRSNEESSISSVDVASTKTTKSNRPKRRQTPSKDQPRKRQRRRQSQDVGRELSPNERKKRRRFMLQALYNWRIPMQPDEVISS